MKLIVMGCSATKRRDPGLIPAIDRYDGPMWQTLRARLSDNPIAARAVRTGELQIMFLSAEHGFQDATMRIENYDRVMTSARADELCLMPLSNHRELARRVADAEDVIFAAGALYRRALWDAANVSFADFKKIARTDGTGIGHHRAQLGGWLAIHYPEP